MVDIKVCLEVIKDVQLVVFDKDGKLIDVHTYWVNMIKFRAESVIKKLCLGEEEKLGLMDSIGVDTNLWKIKPEGPVGIKKREIVLQAGVEYLISHGMSDQTNLFEEVFREVDKNSMNHFHTIIKPLDGLFELFEGLKKTFLFYCYCDHRSYRKGQACNAPYRCRGQYRFYHRSRFGEKAQASN